ncbi:CHAD domain-containing protein [Thermus scotoductus]|uniref:Metal-chelation protein CHAD n=1 Tax=Thermus scotoductus TaxID=37636 RepID=A0A430RGE3_THESC|nr:CHAD domain-containing protein [Thermus scotoductus]RTG96869.1 metal-chelation protein CHAD [Thermus scotoductus]RTH07124.1 metal-chelation protein CHAD [Thermus scotoductus]RTH21547.1 metal-chelation protein CHAD [Thermus scotoductus]RTI01388.1 metal-chelation protein CHAD [Thermus scotoductus]RTI17273.1 metal-chelation protein CHAD [Thermus scotoductus]
MKDARDWVAHLEAHLPLALSGEDPEGVHQVRVAGRRLRAYLDLLGFRVLKDDLCFLVRQAGRVRDLEVALGGPLPEGFREHLRAELSEARRSLVALLRSPWMGVLLRALRHLPPLSKGQARKRLKRLQGRLEARFLELRAEPSLERLHAFRRALRRVRYAKEFLGLSAKRERALQEVLGEVNDLRVLKGLLQAYLVIREDPEAQRYLGEVERVLEAASKRALQGLGLAPFREGPQSS